MNSEPFANKRYKSKDLFKRIHGVSKTCTTGLNTLEFVCPYNYAKMESVQVLWCPVGCTANFKVYDNSSGTISGTPNALLNQFAFNVNVSEGFHEQRSQYDADIILGMKIVLEVDIPTTPNSDIGFNIELNEVV